MSLPGKTPDQKQEYNLEGPYLSLIPKLLLIVERENERNEASIFSDSVEIDSVSRNLSVC